MLAGKHAISFGPLVCMLFFGLSLALADEVQAIEDANEHYQQGWDALNQRNWREAAKHFDLSYKAKPRPDVAYLLSVAYSKLGKFVQASKLATEALSGQSPLTEPFVVDARNIIAWAQRASRVEKESEGKADTVLPPPPNVGLPPRLRP